MKTEKVKLMNIVVDPNIQVREIDEHAVNKYAQAMKVGAQFPPLLLEAKTNRIVCGNHRYRAYQSIYEPDREVSATFQSFECEADIVRAAARDNARHGLPLTTWDQKRIWMRLKEYGDTKEQIAELLSIPVHKIEKWAGLTVVVIGNGAASRQKPVPISKAAKDVPPKEAPLKHGLEHMAGKTVKQSDYKNHEKRDMGISVKNMAAMITRHVTAGWIDVEDPKTMENLRALHAALEKLLNSKKQSTMNKEGS